MSDKDRARTARAFPVGWTLMAALGIALIPAQAAAQDRVVVEPIQCSWKVDRSAIYVGEPFSLTLTCAVIDTESVSVAVDEAALDPATVLLSPFEVLGGERYRDIRNNARRFFQYRYDMRLIGEEFFGRDVLLPRLELTYRVQSSVRGGSAIAGIERRYLMPAEPIRVLSLLPREVLDIRDAPPGTFGDIEVRFFRANLALVTAGAALALGVILLAVAGTRATRKYRAAAPARAPTVSAGAVLGAAAKELAAIQALSQGEGWSGELAGRAATALRLACAVALSHRITQTPVRAGAKSREGQLILPAWGRNLAISAAVTPKTFIFDGRSSMGSGRPERLEGFSPSGRHDVAGHDDRRDGPAGAMTTAAIREGLSRGLKTFGIARYGRPERIKELDAASLDAALAESLTLVRQLRRRHWWPFGMRSATLVRTTGVRLWAR